MMELVNSEQWGTVGKGVIVEKMTIRTRRVSHFSSERSTIRVELCLYLDALG